MNSTQTTRLSLIAAFTALSTLHADIAKDIEEAVTEITDGGSVNLNVRARYEYTDQSGPGTNAAASNSTGGPTPRNADIDGFSIRTRLGFTTANYHGIQAMIEMENLTFADDDVGPQLDVAGAGTELNQLWLSYHNETLGKAKLGRQIYTLDNQRFVGHVGWRQNIQTFDMLSVESTPIEDLAIRIGYMTKVNRVNGQSNEMDNFIFNTNYKVADFLSISGFGYIIQNETNPGNFALHSSNTFGIRATGKYPMNDFTLSYAGSLAHQFDNGASKNIPARSDFSNNYYAFEGTAAYAGFELTGGIEVLEGDGTTGFSTPLATVHGFNGFADVFAGSSLNGGLALGLIDYYAKAGYKIPVGNGVPVSLTYHYFEAQDRDQFFGEELDTTIGYKLNKHLSFLGKAAFYFGENEPGVPTYAAIDKTVLTMEATFSF